MHKLPFEHALALVRRHLRHGLVAMTEHYFVELLCASLAICNHFEPPSRIILVPCSASHGGSEYDVFEEIKVFRI
jgi:hypothetical protein